MIQKALGKNLKAVLFYEEGIKSGGMGMNLSECMRDTLSKRNIKYSILAINDSFAASSIPNQNAFQMASIDEKILESEIKALLNNE